MLRYRLHKLLILLAVAPPALAACWWLWIRGGLRDAIDIVVTLAAIAWSLAGVHFAVKRNLGY